MGDMNIFQEIRKFKLKGKNCSNKQKQAEYAKLQDIVQGYVKKY